MTRFIFAEAVRNLYRYRRRYLLFGVILFAVATTVLSTITISAAAREFIDNVEPQYNKLGFEIFNERAARISGIYYLSNVLTLIFGFLGVTALLFVSTLHINDRIRDIGILYSLGLSRGGIFLGLALETMCFMAFTLIPALLCSRLVTLLVLGDAYDGIGFAAPLVISLVIAIIPISIMSVKIKHTSPIKLLNRGK